MNRGKILDKLKSENDFDIIIIGGGATGLGCAVDASNRGYKTLLLEKNDFSKGTSSRSTKLVHGGVRYLIQGNIRLVKEALFERGRLLKNAPHLCDKLSFVVPTYNRWQKWYYGIGLWVYELLSGKLSLGRNKFLSKKDVLKVFPDLASDNLTGGILYFDGQFNDCRLAINLAQTAINQGALVVNYCGVSGFVKNSNKLSGVRVKDEITGAEFIIKGKAIVNATGIFSDKLIQFAEGYSEKTISLSQGIHLVIDKKKFNCNSGMMIPKTDDGRVLFAIPWQNKLLLGTTDTPVEHVALEPKPLDEEIEFIISHFNRYTNGSINKEDIKSTFVGLRPLVKVNKETNTSVMPRDHVLKVLPSGLVTISGGKWTTYRSMAQTTINKAVQVSGLEFIPSKTAHLKIHGYINTKIGDHLSVYGSDAIGIKQLMINNPLWSEKIHPLYPYTKAEIIWFIENEMAITVEDILARRIRLLFIDAQAAIEVAPKVASILAAVTNKNTEWARDQLHEFNSLAKTYLINN